MWGVSIYSYWGPLSSSLPAQGRSVRPSWANSKPPQQHLCHQGGPPTQSQHLRPWRRWETPPEPGERAGRLSASAQPAARLCLTRIPTPAPPAPLLTLCGWRSGSLFGDSKQPCCPSRAPTQAGAQCRLGGGFSASTIPKEVVPPPPHHTAHHFLIQAPPYNKLQEDRACMVQTGSSPARGAARATGHHAGWCLAAFRRIRKAQWSPYQQLPGKSL